MSLANLITWFRQRPLADKMLREIGANETPKVVFVRTRKELLDESIAQYGTSLAGYGSALLVEKIYNSLMKRLPEAAETGKNPWLVAHKSWTTLTALSAVYYAMPFVRNYVTTRLTGSRRYVEMIGEKKDQGINPNAQQKELKHYQQQIVKTGVLWVASTATLGLATAEAIKSGRPAPSLITGFNRHFSPKGGQFLHFNDLSAVLFWLLPGYGAYFVAASDPYEVKEIALKLGVLSAGMFGFPRLVEPAMKQLANRIGYHPLLGGPENITYAGQVIASSLALGCAPPIMNIFLTHWRVQRDERKKAMHEADPIPSFNPVSKQWVSLPSPNQPLPASSETPLSPPLQIVPLLKIPPPVQVSSLSPLTI